jgi:hypothetical protein
MMMMKSAMHIITPPMTAMIIPIYWGSNLTINPTNINTRPLIGKSKNAHTNRRNA